MVYCKNKIHDLANSALKLINTVEKKMGFFLYDLTNVDC